jgi:polyisoprenoid-binding protein YceI
MVNFPRYDKQPGSWHQLAAVSLSVGLLCIAGCQTAPKTPSGALPPGPAIPAEAAPATAVRYEILADLSDIRFLVYRTGPLARLGHNHVIQAKNIRGEIRLAEDIRKSSFVIAIPVNDFLVDAAEARADEGEAFSPQPDGEAIAGTGKNMLGEKVLDAARYPAIEIKSIALIGPAWGMDVIVRVTMHGAEREMTIPTALEISNEKLVATAFFAIDQTDFGIAPMSVLGGGLQVDNTVKIRMRIVARKAEA